MKKIISKLRFLKKIFFSESLSIIGEKRKEYIKSNLDNENKKIKQEFEDSGDKQEPQETEEINLDALKNQVIKIRSFFNRIG
jgi:hypothetical protein